MSRVGQRALGWREVGGLLRPERQMLAAALACAVVSPVAALALPFAAKLVVDEVIGRGRTELLGPIALGAGLGVLLQAAAAFGAAQAGAIAGHRAVARLRRRLQRHALRLPVAYFDATPTGTLVARCIQDAEQVRALFGAGSLHLVSAALTAVLALTVLAATEWRLTALVTAVLIVAGLALARRFRDLQPAFRALAELQASLAGRLTEVIGGIRLVKTAAAERREAITFARDAHRLLRTAVGANRRVAALIAAIALASGGVGLVLLVLGGQAVVRGAITLGDLALFVFVVGLLGTPLVQAAALGGEVARGLAALGRVREVLALPTEEERDRGKHPVPAVAGAVELEDVSYAYPQGPLVLRNVSLRAPAGSTTVILGPNGAGKSTLFGLLMGLDEPTSGRILIDGRPLSGLKLRDYRRHLGCVLQRAELLDGTIAENVRYARPGASAAEFRRAVRLAHCDEFVEGLPRGYETVVGERGVRLSGGQRQRVAVARALLADPRILILDEITSQLDSKSKVLVEDALRALRQTRTTFVISHSPNTAKAADEILILDGGRVIERGTDESLLAAGGSYRALCQHHNRRVGIRSEACSDAVGTSQW